MVQKIIRVIIFIVLPIMLITACGGLAGDPKIVATIPPQPTSVVVFPSEHPDVALGAEIFSEKCTDCHGIEGKGDGSMVVSGQVTTPIPDFTDAASLQDKSPSEVFEAITTGNLQALMPPFGPPQGTLSDSERWAVAMYVYTLTQDAQQYERGAVIWEAECAECHGESGQGDGPEDVGAANLTNYERIMSRGNSDLYAVISRGRGDVMPAFAGTLDGQQIADVTAYLRTFTLSNVDAVGLQVAQAQPTEVPASTEQAVVEQATPGLESTDEAVVAEGTEEVTSEIRTIIASGSVVNETEGAEVPEGAPVTLLIMETDMEPLPFEGTVNADGTFVIEGVTYRENGRYVVIMEYQVGTYFSQVNTVDKNTQSLDFSVKVFEATDDRDLVAFDYIRLHVFPVEGELQVVQIMRLKTESDRVYGEEILVDGVAPASLMYTLPQNATIIDLQPEQQLGIAGGGKVYDATPVWPDETHDVQIIYSLPYDGSTTLEIPFDYQMNEGLFQIFVDTGVKITTNQLGGPVEQLSENGTPYHIYDNILTVAVGESISFDVSGSTSTSTSSSSSSGEGLSSKTAIAIFLVMVSLILFAIAGYLYYGNDTPDDSQPVRKQTQKAPANLANQAVIDELVRQIAEMDKLFEEKKIDEAAYKGQRQKLKDRLADIMKGQ